MTRRERANAHARIFGKAVLTMRTELGLTTEGLAELSGIPLILLGRIETGIASGDEWGLREIAALAGVLGPTLENLMEKWERHIEEAGEAWWKPKKRIHGMICQSPRPKTT
jgi:transcriptional regulator with XRE-family HTH domain